MGKKKHYDEIMNLFNKSPVVDINSINKIVNKDKKIKQYHKQLVRNLIKQRKIFRLTKGYYSKYEEISLCVFCYSPSYLGLQDALSIHRLWEQETIPIIITTKNVRTGIKKVFGRNVLIKKINKKYFLGFDLVKVGNYYLPYSDVEKTFVDLIYFNVKIDEKILGEIETRIDKQKLEKYLKKYPLRFRTKVMKLLK